MATKKEDEAKSGPTGEQDEGEEMFDLLIPPGVPTKLMMDIVRKYKVEVVTRKEKLYFANMEGDERELLAFRGKKEDLEKVQAYMIEELKKFVGD